MKNNTLSILFEKDGFSFSIFKENTLQRYEHFPFGSYDLPEVEDIFEEKIQQNLYLKQEYNIVNALFLTPRFNLVPQVYYLQEKDDELWISFNTEIYEGEEINHKFIEAYNLTLLYVYPLAIKEVLRKYYPNYTINNASALFVESIKGNNEQQEAEIFINLHKHTLEILCLQNTNLVMYNLFSVQTASDVVYYILNAYKQLGLDTNQHRLYYFGLVEERENLLKMLLNFIRNVVPGTDEGTTLQYFTHFKNKL